MSLPSIPTLPFTIVVELPTRTEVRDWLRRPWLWLAFLVLAVVAGLLVTEQWAKQSRTATFAAVDMSSIPTGARILVDGKAAGTTPSALSVAAGHHRISLQLAGYAEAAYDLHLAADNSVSLSPVLWRSQPEVVQLPPMVPGTTFGGAQFLDDGRVAVTAVFASGRQQIWTFDGSGLSQPIGPSSMRAALSGNGRLLATADAADNSNSSTRATQVSVMATSGGAAPRKVYDLGPASQDEISDLSWAPDGTHVLAAVASHGSGDTQTRLLWLDAISGDVKQLTQTPGNVVAGSYTWLPAGQAVAFLVHTQSSNALALMQLPGGQLHDLADTGQAISNPLPFAPITWSTDGTQVVYQAGQSSTLGFGWLGGKTDIPLLQAKIDGSAATRRAVPSAQFPLWRADGSLVGWAVQDSGKPVSLISLSGPNKGKPLAQLSVQAGSQFAARWDERHNQALIATASGFGPAQYWLVRFELPEAAG